MRSKARGRSLPAVRAVGTNYQTSDHLPVRVPIAVALGAVSAALLAARCLISPPGIIVGFFLACLAATLPISVWCPVLAATSFLLLLTLLEIAGTYGELLVLLGYPLMGSLAAQRSFWWCAAYGVSFSALGFYSIEERKFSADPYSIATHLTFLIIAFSCGWWIKTELQRRYVKRAKVRRERDELAILTHNTVAAELTSLVVRLEVLAMENPHLRKQLEACADSARCTISDVRVLIETMRAATFSSPKTAPPQPDIAVKAVDLTLRAHGFQTKIDGSVGPLMVGDEFSRVFDECLKEITTNILKYGDRSSDVRIQAGVREGRLGVCIENRVSPAPERSQSNRMGLRSMDRRLDAVNGSLTTSNSGGIWQTEVSIPLSENGGRQ